MSFWGAFLILMILVENLKNSCFYKHQHRIDLYHLQIESTNETSKMKVIPDVTPYWSIRKSTYWPFLVQKAAVPCEIRRSIETIFGPFLSQKLAKMVKKQSKLLFFVQNEVFASFWDFYCQGRENIDLSGHKEHAETILDHFGTLFLCKNR